ncbi:cAMP-specific 3',5'-cyclic phosphodiesterase 7B [Halocaridina rubra]|uniref:Phosphodiesterase n=1 Tax=Halocaridina rubra TaxID=373956 RepID=A0AAN8WWL6_HALRR
MNCFDLLDTHAKNYWDVKSGTTVETSLTPAVGGIVQRRRSSSDGWRIGDATSVSALPFSMGSGELGSAGDAEERLLKGASRTSGFYSRFLTLHRRRRRKPPTHQMDKPHRALLDDLYHGPTKCVLSQVGVWNFNAFALDSVCGGRPVSVLCVYLLHKYGLIQHFNFDTVTVWKCFSLIEDGYHASNPYHNAIHAADVTQAMHCYLQEEKIQQYMTPLENLAALVAAVCHDLDHPGVNQPFLIATDNHLAALYKRYLDGESLDMRDPEHRHFCLQIALKCADICNPCRPWDISRKWSHKICDEFYRQGDYERQLNLPVTSACDRYGMSVAKIQTGFIKCVVSPLFCAWDCWLGTGLSTSMVTNMTHNLTQWEKLLNEETAKETAATEVSAPSSDVPKLPVDGDDEDVDDIGGGTTPSSSGDSHQSVLGSLENVSRSLQLGRRHSVPLNFPCLVPRTVIRRESLPEEGGQPLVVETVVMGGVSLTSLRSRLTDPNSTLTTDALLPDPSITAMGAVDTGWSRHSNSRLTRRMSLPPLWAHQHRGNRVLHPLQPLSPTPSEDSTPQNTQEDCTKSKDSTPRTEVVGSSARGTVVDGGGNSVHGNVGNQGSGGGDCCSDSVGGKTHSRSTRSDGVRDCGVHIRNSVKSYQGATFLQSDCSDSSHYRNRGSSKVLVRRASLDSSSSSSKREFLDRLSHEGSKFARVDCSDHEGNDKENQAPLREPSTSRERPVPLWKTRAWRSLNYDEDKSCDPREKLVKPGIYKLNPSQGSMYAHGRRGSAPLLRPEELWGGLRGGAERPDQRYMSTRRGSAPSQQIHHGKSCVLKKLC